MDIYQQLAACMSHENNITFDTAESLVDWLTNEGVLDYDILKETYAENVQAANDA
jgi:hypothetical protein